MHTGMFFLGFFFHSYLLVSCTGFSVEALRGVQLGGLSRHKQAENHKSLVFLVDVDVHIFSHYLLFLSKQIE